jgi:hypothetical protein
MVSLDDSLPDLSDSHDIYIRYIEPCRRVGVEPVSRERRSLSIRVAISNDIRTMQNRSRRLHSLGGWSHEEHIEAVFP